MSFLLGLLAVASTLLILGIVLLSTDQGRRRSARSDNGACDSGADGWSPAFSSGGGSGCGAADSGGDCGGGDGGGGGD